ncbi:DUF1684 domain-containing protein [Actinotalea sp. AC32]|nr:DUF1684 domain-containing protein [Actinotalea sp. AC32]
MSGARARWDVVDWRRRVADLYRAVRAEREPASAHRLWVEGRTDLLLRHPASPVPEAARDAHPGCAAAPYDPAFRFTVRVDTDVEPQRREVPTGTDGTVPFERVGRVELPGLGRLDLWWVATYGGGLFLPLRDATGGRTSYGGGRYVLDTVKGADLGGDAHGLVVDLNFAYPPSCAYDETWACPLPGPGNVLDAPVPVGELSVG